ncbi:MAG: RNA 2',3'-cyclic phosphodiesterase, partial [Motiliproteus sp.]
MRLFTAIDLPDAMKQALSQRCFGLPRCRWFEPQQMHLTLVFIGEINPARKIDIIENLNEIKFPAFELQCQGIGSFRSGVLWLGTKPCEPLLQLQRQIRKHLIQIKALSLDSRKYHPHITLAQMERRNPPALDNFIAFNSGDSYSFSVEQFVLKSSTLQPS